MGQQIPTTTSFHLPDGREVIIETGKLASQTDGSVVVRVGNTMLFACVVSAREAKEGQEFFPLSVDYQEKFAAAGRMPGNFFRRETKLGDYEVLISRLIDRAIRPLFPDGYMNETQVIVNLISSEPNVAPDAFAALAASAALAVSDINFGGPISEVRIARINGEFHINPKTDVLKEADINIILAATMDNIIMVEGESKECSERDLVEAIKVGHEAIKVQCQAQLDLAKKVGDKALVKRELTEATIDEELYSFVKSFSRTSIYDIAKSGLDKHTRKSGFDAIKKECLESLKSEKGEEY